MFEIISNTNLPQLIIHLKVLQNQEKILSLGRSNSNQSTNPSTPNRVKLTYSEDWKVIKNDRELIKATTEGFMLYLQLTEKLNIKFHVKPKQVNFVGNGFNDPLKMYRTLKSSLDFNTFGVEVPLDNPNQIRSPQHELL
jgi:hypothetical protein